MTGRLTIQDIAREAGVSMMTVSRVINNKEGVGQETREAIEQIIQKRGYRPSQVARGLATQRTGTIGLVVPDNSNPFFSEVARAVDRVVYPQGYSLLLCNAEEDPQRELDVLEVLLEKWVDGLILCSSRLNPEQLTPLLAQYPAVVLVNRQVPDQAKLPGADSVVIDDHLGGQMAAEHLIRGGRRWIGFLSGPAISQSGQMRLQGYQQALAAAGIPFRPELVLPCAPTVNGGLLAASRLLADFPELTALFCYNDLVAVGSLQACAETGRVVPDDVAVAGYDDIPLAPLVSPPLTTCRVDREELGRTAALLLLDHMQDGSAGGEARSLTPELIVRASAP
jgi:LacI family transcriptional regulator